MVRQTGWWHLLTVAAAVHQCWHTLLFICFHFLLHRSLVLKVLNDYFKMKCDAELCQCCILSCTTRELRLTRCCTPALLVLTCYTVAPAVRLFSVSADVRCVRVSECNVSLFFGRKKIGHCWKTACCDSWGCQPEYGWWRYVCTFSCYSVEHAKLAASAIWSDTIWRQSVSSLFMNLHRAAQLSC